MTWVLRSRSLHYLSTVHAVSVSIEESDCVFQRRRTQVYVHFSTALLFSVLQRAWRPLTASQNATDMEKSDE